MGELVAAGQQATISAVTLATGLSTRMKTLEIGGDPLVLAAHRRALFA